MTLGLWDSYRENLSGSSAVLFTQKGLERAVPLLQRCFCLPGVTPRDASNFPYRFQERAHLGKTAAFGS